MTRLRRFALALAVSLAAVTGASAYEPDEVLPDPAAEARARAITSELRCLVCQNESIDQSHAPLARDLRVLVRERIQAGDTDREVLDFVVARYGTYVLLRPPVEPQTFPLWFGPFVLALVGLGVVVWLARRTPQGSEARERGLTPEEEARLADLLAARRRDEGA